MSHKKKSAAEKAKKTVLAIIILGVLNIAFSIYFNNKINEKSGIIFLTENSLTILREISAETENLTEISDDFIKNNIERIKKSYNLIKIIEDGGKYEGISGEIKIKPVKKTLKPVLNEITAKHEKLLKTLKKAQKEELNTPVFINIDRILPPADIKFLVRKEEFVKKKLREEIKSMKFRNNLFDILTLIFIATASVFIFISFKEKIKKDAYLIQNKISSITSNNSSYDENTELSEEFENVSENINKVKHRIKEVTGFVNNLLKDNYDVDFKTSEKKDAIQKLLLNLRDKLKENIEINKKRLEEERKRQWFAEGQAKFNDILRESAAGIKKLSETALINMVKFLEAAQGGFFIVNDDENEPYLELISAFAYDRIKMLTKRIEFGEGLVGMCAIEKNTILVTDVPEDYMQIESGLGEAVPENILIIPLKTEDNILGVIEIASFYEFKKEQIEFTENIAEDLAKTLETAKISDKTNELLQETRKKSEELALRDSEMSEKINELRDAQKETQRSESEMNALISVIDRVLFKLELTVAGKISTVNSLFLNKSGYSLSEIRNKSFVEFIKEKDKKTLENIYAEVSENNYTQKNIIFISKDEREIKTSAFFSPVRNEKGDIVRILMLADNISYREDLQKKNELLAEELKSKTRLISEKEKELSSLFNKIKSTEKISPEKADKLLKREKNILENKETSLDKKYSKWLNDLKSEKL